jgi:hypothetical protein
MPERNYLVGATPSSSYIDKAPFELGSEELARACF